VQTDTENYYKTLTATRHSSYSGIRQAYKRVSLKLHPDKQHKNAGPEAAEDFQRVTDIYGVGYVYYSAVQLCSFASTLPN
jgi:DnaJ-class molecular chaperone